MSKQYILTLSIDGNEEINCTPLSTQEDGLGLSEDGLSWKESSFATITVDDHDELVITRTGSVPVSLQRNGRKLELVSNHPTRLLAQDLLQWNANHTHHTFEIKKIYRQNFVSKLLSRLSKHAMITTAAAMLLGVVPGCDVSSKQIKRDIAPIPAENDTVNPIADEGEPFEVVDEDPAQVPMDINRVAGDAEIAPPDKDDTVVPSRQGGKIAVEEETAPVPIDIDRAEGVERPRVINNPQDQDPNAPSAAPSNGDQDVVLPPPELQDTPNVVPTPYKGEPPRPVPTDPSVVKTDFLGGAPVVPPPEPTDTDKTQDQNTNTHSPASSDGGQDAVLPPPELQDPTIVEPQVLLSVPNYSEPSVGTGWTIE